MVEDYMKVVQLIIMEQFIYIIVGHRVMIYLAVLLLTEELVIMKLGQIPVWECAK